MGIVATISRIEIDKFEQMKRQKAYPPQYASGNAYIGKAWDIISYILVGKIGPTTDNLLSEIIHPRSKYLIAENEHQKMYLNYSPPERVKEIQDELKGITESVFRQLIEERDFNTYMMYAALLPKEKDQIFVGLKKDFLDLCQLFKAASENDNYVVTVIS